MKLFSDNLHEITGKERSLLIQASNLLERFGAEKQERLLVLDSIAQLDELFLLVVAGEYNSGKSAFINALLGGEFLETGITPTTDSINILEFGETHSETVVLKGIKKITLPVSILDEIRIVDTPGTNAILQEHEVLTKDYIPRSDIVFFITSVDRPFTESERLFLEQIKNWGKKIALIINKVDLVDDEDDIAKVTEFVRNNAFLLLGHHPKIFLLSAKKSLSDIKAGKKNTLLENINKYILHTLNQRERVRIKLTNPLNILEQLIDKYHSELIKNKENIKDDSQLIDDIQKQMALFKEDAFRRFKFRYADIDNAILQFQNRGIEFFDETFRIGRLFDLANNERIQREYKDKVIKNLSDVVDHKVNDLIEWLVDENFKQWQIVNDRISERMAALKSRIVTSAPQQSTHAERKKIIADVKRESQRVIEVFDRNQEAKQIANDAQMSVAASAAIEVGAIGLGTLVTILATTASADLTGILLAGITATLGFFIIPTKKKQAKTAFNKKTNQLREKLYDSLSDEINRQLEMIIGNIYEIIAPFKRFVTSEKSQINKNIDEIVDIKQSIDKIRGQVDKI